MRELTEGFNKVFGYQPQVMAFAPGRINLIGEHTDYNGGYVFPCAIDLGIWCAASLRDDGIFRLYSDNFSEKGISVYPITDLSLQGNWSDYPVGVIRAASAFGYSIERGVDFYFKGNLPDGAGLSSSAAIELVTGVILRKLFMLSLTPQELALMGQFAENHFIGVNCGIMDQFASAMGRRNHAILLNSNTLDFEYAPLNGAALVAVNSGVRHSLASSAYNDRRRECEAAAKAMRVSMLCSLSAEEFETRKEHITNEVCLKRARHIVYENQRTLKGAEALKKGDLHEFGQLMNASHNSLRDDYEVSCAELDFLVSFAQHLPYVYGSRMTGGGFGGCTVNLVKPEHTQTFIHVITEAYQKEWGKNAEAFIIRATDGAGEIFNRK